MIGARTISFALLLAVASIIGMVGMLVVEGAWDVAFFVLTLLPIPVGLWHGWQHYKGARQARTPP